ncbi:hypothetical protein ANN_23343 [Periplaneta americana]|uniref:Uncharacterized protein n=1 Tax=Periplaneta americana TaxID=6978 RepID=A0ABQ8SKW7_PERAM|nr:hypothetical protein ANN_23343 [Periplaneta americana]
MLGRNAQQRDINTLAQLRATFLEEWDLIPHEALQRLVSILDLYDDDDDDDDDDEEEEEEEEEEEVGY